MKPAAANEITASLIGAVIALVAAFLYVTLNSGFHATDDGFILAQSWRVWNGQLPFRDFVTVRPPLSAYIHSVWFSLPEAWTFRAARIFYFLEMALPPTLLFVLAFKTSLLPARPIAIAGLALSLAFALHCFPPMPWHTVDGLWLSGLGAGALLITLKRWDERKNAFWPMLAGALLSGLAALCKQNFAVVPVAYFGLLGLFVFLRVPAREKKSAVRSIAWTMVITALLLILLGTRFLMSDIRPNLFRQLGSSSTAGGSVLFYGFQNFLSFLYVPFFLFGYFVARMKKNRALALCAPILVVAACFDWFNFLRAGFCLFWLVVGGLAHRKDRGSVISFVSIFTVIITWAGAVSWGYASPILGFGLLAFPLYAVFLAENESRPAIWFLSLTAVFVVAAMLRQQWLFPYREESRPKLVRNLAEIYPRFGKMLTHDFTWERHEDLKNLMQSLSEEDRKRVVVFSSNPLFNWLNNRVPAERIDWWTTREFGGELEPLRQALIDKNAILVAYKNPIYGNGCENNDEYTPTEIFNWLQTGGWRLSRVIRHFCIFERKQ